MDLNHELGGGGGGGGIEVVQSLRKSPIVEINIIIAKIIALIAKISVTFFFGINVFLFIYFIKWSQICKYCFLSLVLHMGSFTININSQKKYCHMCKKITTKDSQF